MIVECTLSFVGLGFFHSFTTFQHHHCRLYFICWYFYSPYTWWNLLILLYSFPACTLFSYVVSFAFLIQMLLMSGLSHNALEELSSERNYEDRIPHLCNMLRFAFLKNGNSFMAIGGSWDTVDGNDPSVDKSTLVQTVLRLVFAWSILSLYVLLFFNKFFYN